MHAQVNVTATCTHNPQTRTHTYTQPHSVATTYADPDAIHNGNSIINLGPIYEVSSYLPGCWGRGLVPCVAGSWGVR